MTKRWIRKNTFGLTVAPNAPSKLAFGIVTVVVLLTAIGVATGTKFARLVEASMLYTAVLVELKVIVRSPAALGLDRSVMTKDSLTWPGFAIKMATSEAASGPL